MVGYSHQWDAQRVPYLAVQGPLRPVELCIDHITRRIINGIPRPLSQLKTFMITTGLPITNLKTRKVFVCGEADGFSSPNVTYRSFRRTFLRLIDKEDEWLGRQFAQAADDVVLTRSYYLELIY